MRILLRLYAQERFVGDEPGVNYAPTVFVQEQEATQTMTSKGQLKAAMVELFRQGRIQIESYGKPSKPRRRIAEAPM